MKIKKIGIVFIIILFLTGCTSVNKMDYDDIVDIFNLKGKVANTYRNGYKYYVPKNLQVIEAGSNYSILSDEESYYYLFFDLLSLYNEKEIEIDEEENIEYFKELDIKNKKGYIKIKLKNSDKYLIEIVYNYAKIEVMVDKERVKNALVNAINVVRCVKYDKNVIGNILANDELTNTEEVYDIFEKVKGNSNILDYIEEIEVEDNSIKDTDFIN